MTDEMNDPEASYRRGYQQGAFHAMEAAEKLVDGRKGLQRLRDWAGVTLANWRYRDRTADRNVQPPPPPAN
jgi:hypothetical protein